MVSRDSWPAVAPARDSIRQSRFTNHESPFPTRTWMSSIVSLRQVLEVQVRVNLRRGNAGMPQHLLHRAQVAARLQHVRGERVPQDVGMDVRREATLERPALRPLLHRTRAEAPAVAADEESGFTAARKRLAPRQPRLDRG